MTNSSSSSTPRSSSGAIPRIPGWAAAAFAALAFIGFLDASYLTVKHFTGGPVPCSIFECDTVLSSPYAAVGPIPVALFGAAYYLFLFFCAIANFDGKTRMFLFAARATVLGFLASLAFMGLQAFVLRAFCLYCVISAVISTLLFAIGFWAVVRNRRPRPSSVDKSAFPE